jgi:hypothetical protein
VAISSSRMPRSVRPKPEAASAPQISHTPTATAASNGRNSFGRRNSLPNSEAAGTSVRPNSEPRPATLEMTTSATVWAVSVSRIRYSPESFMAGRLSSSPATNASPTPIKMDGTKLTPCFWAR